MFNRLPPDHWKRTAVTLSCDDIAAAALQGIPGAVLVDDEMRAKNRGYVIVHVGPGDDLWDLCLEALDTPRDWRSRVCLPQDHHEPGHA